MAAIRLGDTIDDHCSRCHMIMDHSVVAMVGEEVKRVRCRTCNHEHDYRQAKTPQKKPKAKPSPYEQVLASITAGHPTAAPPPPPAKPRRAARNRARMLPKRGGK